MLKSVAALAALLGAAQAPAVIDFNRDIRPIFNRHCTGCHGGVKQAGGVSFIHRDKALGEGKSGERTIVPGRPTESALIQRILSTDKDERMPPPDHGDGQALPAREAALLRQWIEEGAAWGEHWAFRRPEPQTVPAVKDRAWPRNAVDHFILAQLEHSALQPSPTAAPAQWLRRVTLDLTGLPPTPEELTTFVAGRETPEQAVERLLAAPAFGERWASLWLDLARYADTQGYEKDNGREIWPWRDWLVRSLNADLPFDQFTIKALAGDLLPNATLDDVIATGFHRNTQTNTEGGTDDEEFRLTAVIDRVNTTWTVWQGTTFGCVQCHAHPYDAFTHEDYYRFLAIWNSTEDADLGDDFPRQRVPQDPARFPELHALDQQARAVRAALNAAATPLVARENWKPLEGLKVSGPKDARFTITGHEVRVDGTVPNGATYVVTLPDAAGLSALRLDLLPRGDDPKQWPEHGAVVGQLWLEIEDPVKVAAARVEAAKIDAEEKALAETGRAARAAEKKAAATKPGAAKNESKNSEPKPRPTGIDRVEFAAVYADTLTGPYDPEESLKPGGAGGGAFPKLFGPRWLVFVPKTPVRVPPGATARLHLKHDIFSAEVKGAIVHHFRLAGSTDPAWTALVNSPERAAQQQQLAEVRKKLAAIPAINTLVMRERPGEARRETRVFARGNFLAKDKVVEPGAPANFPPLPPGPADRLAAARWLISPEHPLTARVMVNRVWAELFGIGLVETLEDFGSTGLPPSHPELLDFLALRFQGEHRWSLKTLLRELVLSATYRQDHRASPELLARDPRNRLLARGPRTRLTAEMVRDQALAAAGLLSRKMGGPPVMPPQPDGVWQMVYNGAEWVTPKGEDRYRRGLYTYWRRTSPYPSFITFDASSREVCTARRMATNTPLQALVTLNDPVYFEAAQALARRMLALQTRSIDERIAWALTAVTSDPAAPGAVARLSRLHQDALKTVVAAPDTDPAFAALTLVASTILNLDEALTK